MRRSIVSIAAGTAGVLLMAGAIGGCTAKLDAGQMQKIEAAANKAEAAANKAKAAANKAEAAANGAAQAAQHADASAQKAEAIFAKMMAK